MSGSLGIAKSNRRCPVGNRSIGSGIVAAFLACMLMSATSVIAGDFVVPSTISVEARAAAAGHTLENRNFELPMPDDVEGWREAWQGNEEFWKKANDEVVKSLGTVVEESSMGGVRVLDVKPKDWSDNGKVLVYTHGGAYVLFSAASTLISSAPVADATGLRVVSVDYDVPPESKWQDATGQVVAVIKALLEDGYGLNDIAIYGDSAGGALAAGSVLRARDEGLGLPSAVVLWSPWSDITETGDTYATLRDDDPLLIYENNLARAADAYADRADQKHPYVSPVYGDYGKGFPPTLIQVGTKEIFLSNAVRHYHALDQAGVPVTIDPYEGMSHVFQAFTWEIPESYQARRKMAAFLRQHLGE